MSGPTKKQTLLDFLERGIAMIHLDARRPGVVVPPQHAQDPHLRLNLSYRYGIPDLVIDDTHVQASLSFRGRSFQCKLPWTAVFGVTSHANGQGQVWPEDLPLEVRKALEGRQEPEDGAPTGPEDAEPPPADEKGRPVLVLMETPAARPVAVEPAKSSDEDPREPPKRPHLRLVR